MFVILLIVHVFIHVLTCFVHGQFRHVFLYEYLGMVCIYSVLDHGGWDGPLPLHKNSYWLVWN